MGKIPEKVVESQGPLNAVQLPTARDPLNLIWPFLNDK